MDTNEKPGDTVSSTGEFGLIRRIRSSIPAAPTHIVIGPGDDAAVIAPPPGTHLVVTTDSMIEGVHFRMEWIEPFTLGRRVVVQGLSDLAAMGARPLGAVVALSFPPETGSDFLDAFLRGLLEAARSYSCPLAGGNLARSRDVTATASVFGAVFPSKPLRRDRARVGDELWVTGFPGSSAAGLGVLSGEGAGSDRDTEPHRSHLERRFLFPEPRIEEAAFLRDSAGVCCAIDLSDGIRRCSSLLAEESRVSIEVDASACPVDEALAWGAARLGKEPRSLALDGGEDFELLFTAPPGAVDRVLDRFESRFSLPLAKIGSVREGSGLTVLHDPGEASFEHF